jgi:hypothetical protein
MGAGIPVGGVPDLRRVAEEPHPHRPTRGVGVTKVALDPDLKDLWVEGAPIYAAGDGPYIGFVTAQWEDDEGLWVDVELTPEARGIAPAEEDPDNPFG